MPTKKQTEPLPLRVQSSFQQLSAAAASLNTATDRLSKLVAKLDLALKPLNVGLVCWVNIVVPLISEDASQTYLQQIGYAKIGGKWGIAVRTVSEGVYRDDADIEQWAFNDAPRELRLRAIDRIPELLDELTKEAAKTTKKFAEKSEEVQRLVSAVKGGTSR